jgi:hypothetical protein
MLQIGINPTIKVDPACYLVARRVRLGAPRPGHV